MSNYKVSLWVQLACFRKKTFSQDVHQSFTAVIKYQKRKLQHVALMHNVICKVKALILVILTTKYKEILLVWAVIV